MRFINFKNKLVNSTFQSILRFLQLYLILAALNVIFDNDLRLLTPLSYSTDYLFNRLGLILLIVLVEFKSKYSSSQEV
ncbi:MAG: hypothetical protein U0J50_05070 [Peptacetobacter hiranonis]|nr:hypothetical protein [Peptacetobacter hiranonis]